MLKAKTGAVLFTTNRANNQRFLLYTFKDDSDCFHYPLFNVPFFFFKFRSLSPSFNLFSFLFSVQFTQKCEERDLQNTCLLNSLTCIPVFFFSVCNHGRVIATASDNLSFILFTCISNCFHSHRMPAAIITPYIKLSNFKKL